MQTTELDPALSETLSRARQPGLTLVIGNKNYSSWSMRPWVAAVAFGIPFNEVRVLLDQPETAAIIARFSHAGRVPVLVAHGKLDRRVPIAHSEKMVAALKEGGKEVQWMPMAQEGHGIFHEENQERFFQALFKLLDTTIGHPVRSVGQAD